jgi:hypothetical protein
LGHAQLDVSVLQHRAQRCAHAREEAGGIETRAFPQVHVGEPVDDLAARRVFQAIPVEAAAAYPVPGYGPELTVAPMDHLVLVELREAIGIGAQGRGIPVHHIRQLGRTRVQMVAVGKGVPVETHGLGVGDGAVPRLGAETLALGIVFGEGKHAQARLEAAPEGRVVGGAPMDAERGVGLGAGARRGHQASEGQPYREGAHGRKR